MLFRMPMITCLKVQQKLPITKTNRFCRDNIVCLNWVKLCYPFLFLYMQSKLKQQKLTLFSVMLLVLFTYPVVSLANRPAFIYGIPVLFFYIFIVWIIAIIVLYRIAEGKQKKSDEQ